jgi:hypothetical protein
MITLGDFLLLFFLAFICEFIDSGFGMGYGTILTPLMLILGYSPAITVPAILLSQAFGGFSASIFHHRFENSSWKRDSDDLKTGSIIAVTGVVATIFAVFIGISLPKNIIKGYIGILVLSMGILILLKKSIQFSYKNIFILSIISAFNKGISGGGFGPVITSGQIIAGQKTKTAVSIAVFSEIPICLTGAFTYFLGNISLKGNLLQMPMNKFLSNLFSENIFNPYIFIALTAGSIIVAPFGAFMTSRLKTDKLQTVLGIFVIILGLWTLSKAV